MLSFNFPSLLVSPTRTVSSYAASLLLSPGSPGWPGEEWDHPVHLQEPELALPDLRSAEELPWSCNCTLDSSTLTHIPSLSSPSYMTTLLTCGPSLALPPWYHTEHLVPLKKKFITNSTNITLQFRASFHHYLIWSPSFNRFYNCLVNPHLSEF